LFEQVISPAGDDAAPQRLAPVLLSTWPICVPTRPCSADDECSGAFTCDEELGRCVHPDGDAYRDCDGDGLRGLPDVDEDDPASLALWRDCVEACVPPPGEAVGARSCVVEDERFDCDDDGDGQPDITEDPACYGPGRGADADGDL